MGSSMTLWCGPGIRRSTLCWGGQQFEQEVHNMTTPRCFIACRHWSRGQGSCTSAYRQALGLYSLRSSVMTEGRHDKKLLVRPLTPIPPLWLEPRPRLLEWAALSSVSQLQHQSVPCLVSSFRQGWPYAAYRLTLCGPITQRLKRRHRPFGLYTRHRPTSHRRQCHAR